MFTMQSHCVVMCCTRLLGFAKPHTPDKNPFFGFEKMYKNKRIALLFDFKRDIVMCNVLALLLWQQQNL